MISFVKNNLVLMNIVILKNEYSLKTKLTEFSKHEKIEQRNELIKNIQNINIKDLEKISNHKISDIQDMNFTYQPILCVITGLLLVPFMFLFLFAFIIVQAIYVLFFVTNVILTIADFPLFGGIKCALVHAPETSLWSCQCPPIETSFWTCGPQTLNRVLDY
jgi:hypothetical protein